MDLCIAFTDPIVRVLCPGELTDIILALRVLTVPQHFPPLLLSMIFLLVFHSNVSFTFRTSAVFEVRKDFSSRFMLSSSSERSRLLEVILKSSGK